MPLFLIVFALCSNLSFGQVVTQTEGIESSIFPPPGWGQIRTVTSSSGAFSLRPYAGTSNPTVSAPSGAGLNCMMFNSNSSLANDTAILITKPYDFSQNNGVNPTFSFRMYRDNGFTANNDKIEVFINTIPSNVGMVPINHSSGTNFINRPNTSFPVVAPNTWQTYTFTLPASTYNQRKYYFIIRGISAQGNNIYLDNFVTNTYPSKTIPQDVSFSLAYQNTASVSNNQSNAWIVGIKCIIDSTFHSGCGNAFDANNLPVKLDSLLFNSTGTTLPANISNAKVYYTSGHNKFSTDYISPFPSAPSGFTFPTANYSTPQTSITNNILFTNQSGGNCFYLEYDTTYFWLTYDLASTSSTSQQFDADFLGASVGGKSCPSIAGTSVAVGNSGSLPGAVSIGLPYCYPLYSNTGNALDLTFNDYINTVQLIGYGGASISSSTNSVALQNPLSPCYPNCNYTSHAYNYELRDANIIGNSTVLQEGSSYSITVQVGSWYTNNSIAAWMDWNRDGDFVDTGEQLGYANLPGFGTATWNFTVPSGFTGITRLRVREAFGVTSSMSPCATYAYGETEDFDITIIPFCSINRKLWLGFTSDWNNPGNWCPSIPTVFDSVVVDKAQVPNVSGRNYYGPIIKSGVTANCKNMLIASNDTLTIDAPSPGSNQNPPLKIVGNLVNNGQLKFNTSYNADVNFSNGTLLNFSMTPFAGKFYKAAQTQIIYSAAELAAQGIQNGDRIKALKFLIKNNDVGLPTRQYQNFQISFKNDSTIPLSHDSTFLQTGGFISALAPTNISVTSGWITINLTNPIVVDPSFNLLIQYCYSNPGSTGSTNNDYIDITQTAGRNSTLILGRLTTSAASSPSACSFTGTVAGDITANGSNVASNLISSIAQFRPNVTFVIDRPYDRPRFVLQGDLINNNSFVCGKSIVVLDSSKTQNIGGSQSSSFFDLEMAKTTPGTNTLNNVRPVILNQPITVQDTLKLTAGQLIMNGRKLTMTNPNPEAFWRTQTSVSTTTPGVGTGFLISESSNSQVDWVIGNYVSTKQRYIPFGHRVDTVGALINYIPLGFRHTAGDMGTFSASSYYALNNLPLPPTVSHLNTFASTNQNQAATADRFWMIGKTGANPVADLSLRISNTAAPATERATGWVPVGTFVKAQPWRANGLNWLRISDPGAVASQAVITNAVGSGGVVTYTTSTAHGFRVGSVINTFSITPTTYNLLNAVIASTPTATTFTVNNPAVGAYVSGGNVSPFAPAVGGTPYINRQTTNNYTQAYAQVAAAGHDSLRISAYDWPIVPTLSAPYFTPAAPIGDFTPWALASNNVPLGSQIVQSLSIQTDSIVNASCQASTNGAIYISISGGNAPYSYVWSQGSATQDITGLSPGNYTVTITDANGITAIQTFTVNYNFSNLNPFSAIVGSNSVCLPSNGIYSIQPVAGATSYVWSVPVTGATISSGQGTTSLDVNFAANYQSGNAICVIASNQCSSQQACITVNSTSGLPAVPSTITGPAQGICNSTNTYYVTNNPALSYVWTLPTGATLLSGQGSNSISVSFSNTFLNGAINVYATNACGSSAIKSKNVFGKPAKPTNLSGPSSLCIGTQGTFTCSSAVGATSYLWTVPSGVTIVSGQGTTSIIVNSSSSVTNGSICIKAVNSCGTTSSTCKTINILPATISTLTITGTANGVCNSNKTYTATVVNGGVYSWTVPSGCSIVSGQGTNQIVVSFTNTFSSGNIGVSVSTPCVLSATASKIVRGYPATPTSITGPTLVCDTSLNVIYTCASSATATNYNWVVPAGFTINSGQGTNSVIVNINTLGGGTGIIKAKANNTCGSSAFKSLNLTYQVCREGKFENNTINIYPNPANNETTIEISNAIDEQVIIQCTNAIGQIIYQESINVSNGITQMKLNTSEYNDGLYFINVSSKSIPTSVYKLVISR